MTAIASLVQRRLLGRYSSGVTAAMLKHSGASAVHAQARELWETDIAEVSRAVRRFTLQGGKVWGTGVQVDAYLIGPVTIHAELRTPDG